MSCTAVRQALLASEYPELPAADEEAHLRHCPACRAWHARLLQLERQVRRLPLPASAPPAALLAHLRDGSPAPLIQPPRLLDVGPHRRSEGGRQKLALACSLAATLALFTLGWWAWPQPADAPPPVTPVAASPWEVARTQRLRLARTPHERLLVVVDLADESLAEARRLGQHPDELARLARHYDRLVQRDLIRLAIELPAADRAVVLAPLAERLRRAESEASRLASEWDRQHAASADSLRQMAATAREADRQLRLLVLVAG